MPEFRKAKIEDKKRVDGLLAQSGCPVLEYNFTTLFIWQEPYEVEIAFDNNMIFVRSGIKSKSYLLPCGSGDLKKAVDEMFEFDKNPLKFHSLTEKQKLFLEENYPGRFEFAENRDMEDYVYTAESLMNLKGKKLSSKRNHINRFVADNPDWKYENIDSGNIKEVNKMHEEWCSMAEIADRPGLAEETIAVKKAIEYYEPLGLSGGLIRAGGRVVAFSMGDKLNENTFLVHIEKAFNNINGAYPIINREFVIHNCAGFEYVNREDDAGDEGLRRAKLSYRPAEIVKKYNAREIQK